MRNYLIGDLLDAVNDLQILLQETAKLDVKKLSDTNQADLDQLEYDIHLIHRTIEDAQFMLDKIEIKIK